MVHSHEGQDGWSSLSSVDSLPELSVPTPPPSKGNGSGSGYSSGFRRLNARTAADIAKSASATAAMAERSHSLPTENEIKADRYRYAPSDREIWRPAIEQLSQKLSEQQHEIWELQSKLRDEAQRNEQLVKMLKIERKEHKEVVTALTSELSARRGTETAAQAEATRRLESELERAWKRCAELEQQRRAAEEDAAAKKQQASTLEMKVSEMQTQIAGLKLIAAEAPAISKSDEQSEAANAKLRRENTELKDNLERMNTEIEALRVASSTSSSDTVSLEALRGEMETLKSNNSALQNTCMSLKAALETQTQQSASQVRQAEDAVWNQASHLAAEKIAEAAKRTDSEIRRLNEKTESQAAVVASQKEIITMANAQLEYMRHLLGESLSKLLDQRQQSSPTPAQQLQPSPLHPSVFRPSPPPQVSSKNTSAIKSPSSNNRLSTQKKPRSFFETPKSSTSPRRHSYHEDAKHTPVREDPPESTPSLDTDESSLGSLSTVERNSDLHADEWVSRTPADTYPLQQSTVNHSTSMASSTSTPDYNKGLDTTSSHRKQSKPGISFLDVLHERLAKGLLSREELEDFESIYDARADIMAERPGLELEAKTMLNDLRPQVSRKHAAIVSRMAHDMS